MTEIKNIVFTDCKKNPLTRFFCFINYLLPLRLKYANESFVALNDNIQQGLITLVKDTKSHTRFKITKLILEENSTSIANQLVNYVISRYIALRAHAFDLVVDEKSDILLNIFKNELNFRTCGYEYLYKINSINTSCTLFLKPFKKELIKNVCNFYNESINSFNRFLFSRETYQFLNKYEKFIFYNDDENKILGYFEVATRNHVDYYINFTIDFAYNIYLTDAIKFIYSKLKQRNKNFNLYIKIKDYFMNSKELLAILNENNMEFISKSKILAKDYFKEIKNDSLFKNTKIIFNDPTTA